MCQRKLSLRQVLGNAETKVRKGYRTLRNGNTLKSTDVNLYCQPTWKIRSCCTNLYLLLLCFFLNKRNICTEMWVSIITSSHLLAADPGAILQLYSLSWEMSPPDTSMFTPCRSESLNLTREPCPQASPQDFWAKNAWSCTLGHWALTGLCFSWIQLSSNSSFHSWLDTVNHFLWSKSTCEETLPSFSVWWW